VTPPPARRRGSTGVRELAEAFARVYVEVESGRRTAAQARRILDPRLALRLEGVWCRPGPPSHVVRVLGTQVTADVYEAVAVVRRGERAGAVALRLERTRGRWLVVDASRPEDGVLPHPPHGYAEDVEDADDVLDPPLPDRPLAALRARR
jgi:hypothetical protein